MSRPSLDLIIAEWALENGGRWHSDSRLESLMQLFTVMKQAGYEDWEVRSTKNEIMNRLVAAYSAKGQKGLNNWRMLSARDFKDGVVLVFRPDENAAPHEPGPAQPEIVQEPAQEVDSQDLDEQQEREIDGSQYTKDVPLLDLSIFQDIKVTPIMSTEDFLETLKRENNGG